MRLSNDKIVYYNENDPRYNLTIKDSNRHNLILYPDRISKICSFKKDTNCINQRYENCNNQTSFDCLLNISTNEIDESVRELKKINDNSFYDVTKIPINENIIINRQPDIIENFNENNNISFIVIVILTILLIQNIYSIYIR